MVDQNSQFYAILTNIGAAKQANADALGIPWKITQMAIGDGNPGGVENPPLPMPSASATALLNEWRRAPLNQLKVDEVNGAVIVAEQIIPADVGGRWIREIALYDADGDMVAVANCPATYKPLLSQGSGRTQVVRMNLIVSSSSNVELKIDPSVVLATREWVTSELAKQDFKHSVLVATTAAIALSGLQTVDGVPLTAGVRVLVKNQAVAKDNGLYQVVAGGPWVRSADADNSVKVTPGLLVMVERGTINGDSAWQLVTDAPITVGVTALAFEMAFGRTGVAEGTFRSVTVDKYGRVVAASSPTTVAGYGLTDVYTKTEIDTALALKAPLASPIFTVDPKAPTPAQFDASKSIATAEFVQRALGSLRGVMNISGTITLTAAHVGVQLVGSVELAGKTITLPPVGSVPPGAQIHFSAGANLAPLTIKGYGAELIAPGPGGGYTVNSFEMVALDSVVLANLGNVWRMVGGSQMNKQTGQFSAVLAGNGYQKLPSGLIIQWGAASNTNGFGTWTFPIAFPNACLRVFASQDASGSGSAMYAVGANPVDLTTAKVASALASGGDAIFVLAIGY
ncbi:MULTISPECIES: phage tail protein [Pseudomonas]|uniref:Phage tail protein n=1 Tax=Pseudomonas putida TaxID=303 RepID=A0A1B2FA13_PSEPU|nr:MULTISPECIES: phage tail protein [Pseudomonas]ANY88984.1 hypothetical protein IEC33019_3464 [Pseudomonas putida]MCL8305787.1 phage tail protein [Pseudomonas putida]